MRGEKVKRREGGVGNSGLWVKGLFVFVGKVVFYSLIVIQFFSLFSFLYFIFHIPFMS